MAKEDDSVTLIKVIDTVARAKGMTKIAKEAGISREGYTLVPTRIAKKTEI